MIYNASYMVPDGLLNIAVYYSSTKVSNEVYNVVDKLGLIILAGGLSTRMGQP